MSTLEDIEHRLEAHPELRYRRVDDTIIVDPASSDGFSVSVYAIGDELVVGFGDLWHEHCESPDEALRWFLFGLTNLCRLKVVSRGTRPYRATAQQLTEGHWRNVSSTGLLFWPFWKQRCVEYRQNDLISFDAPAHR